MNSVNLNPHADELQEALVLLSRQMDADVLTSAEVNHLAALEVRFPRELEDFRQSATSAGKTLRSLTVEAVSGEFLNRVNASLKLHQPGVIRSPRHPFRWLPVVASLIAVALLVVLKPRVFEPDAWLANPASAGSARWNVVVVRVESADKELAMREIEGVADEYGLTLHEPAPYDHPEWVGVVLASMESREGEFLSAIKHGVTDSSLELNPLQVADTTPEQLVAAVENAMSHPTQSELHHGRIFLAVPRGGGDQVPTPEEFRRVVAKSAAARAGSESAVARNDKSQSELHDALPELPPSAVRDAGRLTLVVFEFTPAKPSGASADDKI